MLKLIPPGTKKGQKTWYVRGTIKGKQIVRSTGCDKKRDAERALLEIQASLEQGDGPKLFAEAVTLYVKQGGEARFLGPILKQFAEHTCDMITQEEVARIADEIYPNGSAATKARQVYTPIRAIMEMAADAKMCAPVRIKAPKIPKPPPRPSAGPEWFAKVIPECPVHLAALILFQTMSGARISEALNVLGRNLDMENGTVEIFHTKNGKPRIVDLHPIVSEAIEAIGEIGPNDRVFRYTHRHNVRPTLVRACERAGVEYLSTHEYGRHTFARRALREGWSLQHVKEGAGWLSIKPVADTYGHLEQSHLRAKRLDLGDSFRIKYGKSQSSDEKQQQ